MSVGDCGFNFGEDLGHERLASEAWDDGHDEEEVDLVEVGECVFEWGGGVEGEAGEATGLSDGGEGLGDVVVGFWFDMDGDEVGAGLDEAGEVVIGPGDHEVDVEEDVVCFMDCLDDGGAE